MSLLLPLFGVAADSTKAAWETFIARRDNLTAQMQMAVCDGCDGCGLRCMDGFTITQQEWEAVQEYLAVQAPAEVERIRTQVKTVPWPGAAESGVPDVTVSYCPFRDMDQGNCSIYPVRPTVCRLFGHTDWLPCPIEAVTHFPEGAQSLWSAYRKFERHTFTEWKEQEHAKKILLP